MLRDKPSTRGLYPAPAAGIGLAMLAACGPIRDKPAEVKAKADQAAYASAEGRIPCRLLGQATFEPVCTIDRAYTQDGLYLTVRHPDGGFQRLLVTHDGRGVAAADGAERARVRPVGTHEIEVALGGSRYRLPATVRGQK